MTAAERYIERLILGLLHFNERGLECFLVLDTDFSYLGLRDQLAPRNTASLPHLLVCRHEPSFLHIVLRI